MSNLIYDDEWVVTLSNNSYTDLDKHVGGFAGNGKIAVNVSMVDLTCQKTLISGNVQFNQIGKYQNNTIAGFNLNNIHLLSNTSSNITYTMAHQKLRMDEGEVETSMQAKNNGVVFATAVSKVLPLRQYPYCILHTVEFTPSANMAQLDFFHEVRCPDASIGGISGLDYNNNVIYNESVYEDKGLYVLSAAGTVNTLGCKIASASCYFFEDSNMQNLGYNMYNDKSRAYQKYRYTGLVAGTTYRLHILSAMMTSYDFPDPVEEVKRILINIAFKVPSISTLVSRLREESKEMWDEMWKGDVEIVAKGMITGPENTRVMRSRMWVRMSLFNMYSCLRHAVNTEINPLNLSYIDANGNVFFDGDLYMIPALIFLKPQIARVTLEFKYRLLEQALQLAGSFGYKGSKFPYKNDVVGYTNVYWDVISPLHIFNNAAVSINIWNYYRVTLDREWLYTKGYTMMKNIAEFLTSYIDYVAGVYTVPSSVGLGSIICTDHAFTINMALLALRYTIEASHVLNYIPNTKWSDILLRMAIPTINDGGPMTHVIKYHGTYNGSTNVDILDNLLILFPYYSFEYFRNSLRGSGAIDANLTYYASRVNPAYEDSPLNNMIRAGVLSVLAQSVTGRMGDFYDALDNIYNENMKGYWGIMNAQNLEAMGNDVSLNGLLVLIILICVCGLKIRGSTAPSNVTTENYRITSELFTYMPNTWRYVNVGAVGNEGVFVNISNNLAYP